MASLICGLYKEMTQLTLQNREDSTDLEIKRMVAGRRDSEGVWEGHVHAAVFKLDNRQGPSV